MTGPRILIRADAAPEIGGGHVMRCLSLARALAARGAQCAFLTNAGAAEAAPALARSGFTHASVLAALKPPFDILIADHYGISAPDETALKAASGARAVAVIDDLADRPHACDLLIDHNYGKTAAVYAGRLPPHATVLAAADYALLGPGYAQARDAALTRRASGGEAKRVLIALGMMDAGAATLPALATVRLALPDAQVDVVTGPAARSRAVLEAAAEADPQIEFTADAEDMPARMTAADIAVGAGGGSALERCCLGLPSVILILADNQEKLAKALFAAGAGVAVDAREPGFETALCNALIFLAGDPARRETMSRAAAAICDGQGAARAADAILALAANGQPAAGLKSA
ncbi:MAG: UDP-2,4-diacetamido-2,4,6-trideoxy-beta-L-altropyranose hydrolase [Maricaulaceae bacterium]|nr:UDP-2,4-diacetamido-2,4,6-trideoxy-beta-L-altropyranose hydrolase [Maricaulaceae bacterium]